MYNIFVKYTCREGKRESFVESLKSAGIVDAIRGEKGCVRYDYYFSETDPSELLLIEAWEDKEDQKVHMTQPHMSELRKYSAECIVSTEFGEFELL